MVSERQTLDTIMKECMDLRILLAKRYHNGTFRVLHHQDIPKTENVKVTKKMKSNVRRLSINYDSNQINHEDLLNYLSDNGYSHFALSHSDDEMDDYDARLVGYLRPELTHFSKFL